MAITTTAYFFCQYIIHGHQYLNLACYMPYTSSSMFDKRVILSNLAEAWSSLIALTMTCVTKKPSNILAIKFKIASVSNHSVSLSLDGK